MESGKENAALEQFKKRQKLMTEIKREIRRVVVYRWTAATVDGVKEWIRDDTSILNLSAQAKSIFLMENEAEMALMLKEYIEERDKREAGIGIQ